jgi:hypothetical protein
MITFVVTLLILGVLWYLAENYIPMPPPMRVIVRVVCLVLVIFYIARFFGVL